RLDELRLEAVSDRIEARLSMGRIAGVIPELEGLVEEHPLRERPRAQLMRALYAAGRQSDAPELYRRTRAPRMDELGLERGPELRALEQRILTQDPTLDAPKEAERARRRKRRGGKLLLVGGVLVASAAVAGAVIESNRGGTAGRVAAPGSVAAVDSASGGLT